MHLDPSACLQPYCMCISQGSGQIPASFANPYKPPQSPTDPLTHTTPCYRCQTRSRPKLHDLPHGDGGEEIYIRRTLNTREGAGQKPVRGHLTADHSLNEGIAAADMCLCPVSDCQGCWSYSREVLRDTIRNADK